MNPPMNPTGQPESEPIEVSGQIERITYFNEENGYTIARVKVYGRRELVTVVGNLMAPAAGEILKMRGFWTQHPRFGEQFKIVEYRSAVPASVYGIKKYLGSGLIPGLGPKIAERIVASFGSKTLEVIEADAGRLTEVRGVGQKRLAMIREAWEDQKEIRQVMLFLQAHGVSSGYATKIFKQYGNQAISVVTENPYRLATDIFGIGFITADHIAAKLGIAPDCPLRIEAGILYVLHQLAEDGHVYYPSGLLIDKSAQILNSDKEGVAAALFVLAAARKIILEDLSPGAKEAGDDAKAVFLAKFHACETGIAKRLRLLIHTPNVIRPFNAALALTWVQHSYPCAWLKSNCWPSKAL
jgi:exodeoxyribonuclease V alpha subunit